MEQEQHMKSTGHIHIKTNVISRVTFTHDGEVYLLEVNTAGLIKFYDLKGNEVGAMSAPDALAHSLGQLSLSLKS